MNRGELSGIVLSIALAVGVTAMARGNDTDSLPSNVAEAAGQATPTKKPATPRATSTAITENTPRPTPRPYATRTPTPFSVDQAVVDAVAVACDAIGQPVRICPTSTPLPPDYLQPGAPRKTSTPTPRRTNRP